VARLGGDEFAILLEQITTIDAAMPVAERILESMIESIRLAGHHVTVSASIGVALSGQGGIAFQDTLRGANAATYRAKARGGCCYVVFDAVEDGLAPTRGLRQSNPPQSSPPHPVRRVS